MSNLTDKEYTTLCAVSQGFGFALNDECAPIATELIERGFIEHQAVLSSAGEQALTEERVRRDAECE